MIQPQRENSGPFFLEKVARQYAINGDKSFTFGRFASKMIFIIEEKLYKLSF